MESYIELNRQAYDALAHEYAARSSDYVGRDAMLVAPLVVYLRTKFPRESVKVLDIGPGSGLNMSMLAEAGFGVHGVELSPRMASLARERAPSVTVEVADFLTWQYGGHPFHGVFSKASLHLFDRNAADRYLRRCHELMVPDGMLYVSVQTAPTPTEGVSVKEDYGVRVERYKRVWVRDELLAALEASQFAIVHDYIEVEEAFGKNWINVWALRAGSDDG